MDKSELEAIAGLGTKEPKGPRAQILQPEVRSGASFTYTGSGGGGGTPPAFLLVWFYTVAPDKRRAFAAKVGNYENSGVLPSGHGVEYRGTYSVSISSAAPEFEYRTVWGLQTLGNIDDLNTYLGSGVPQLQDVLDLIAVLPAMRSEIMGRTALSIPAFGGTASGGS